MSVLQNKITSSSKGITYGQLLNFCEKEILENYLGKCLRGINFGEFR